MHRDQGRLYLPVLLATAYLALGAAWLLGNPAGVSPDEPYHFLKALAVSDGDLAGRPARIRPSPSDDRSQAWLKRTAREVRVPAGLSPEGLACNAGRESESARCQEAARPDPRPARLLTYIGPTQPTAYLVPGMLARAADEPAAGIRLARLGSAVTSFALLGVAIALLWQRGEGGVSLVGLLVAATPMVLFLASSVTASGPEITAGICFFSALLRVTRGPPARAAAWVALAVSGAILAASRSLGPLWVLLAVVIVTTAFGGKRLWAAVRSAGPKAAWSWAAVGLGLAFGTVWEITVQPHEDLGVDVIGEWLSPSLRELSGVLKQQIGIFGSLDAPMPAGAYVAWWALLAALVLIALLVGSWRERAALGVVVVLLLAVTLLVSVVNHAQTGHGMQGRYVLPTTVTLPLLAAEIVFRDRHRHRHRRPGPRALSPVLWFAVVVGCVQAVGWYANARRSAVGLDGPWFFADVSEWSPGTGWTPLFAVVALGAAAMIAFGVGWAARRRASEPAG